jgi:hypothetical protein
MTTMRAKKLKVIVPIAAALVIAISAGRGFADDDWEVVPSTSPAGAGVTSAAPAIPPPAGRAAHGGRGLTTFHASQATTECGERAVAPAEPIARIVAQIDAAWGTNVRVYQSVAPEGPHALAGGCIFYNPKALALLLGTRLDLTDQAKLTPMLYAIFAHEVGHEYHGDFDPSRAAVPNEIKELEADRFAGFTMQKLGVPATGLAPYWSMTGDEFGIGAKHGTSAQRVAAFKQGWHEAEWNRAENSKSVTMATQESIAPEDSSAAP